MATEASSAAAPQPQPSTLVTRIRAGDGSAEEELVTAYRRGIFAIAVARTHDREAARDLTQEILIAVLKALRAGQLREADKLAAFIQGTARNLINNYLRSRMRRPEAELTAAEMLGSDPVEELERSEHQQLLRRELESLGALDRRILLLALVGGHQLEEVAQRLGMSHEAVRARKSRAIKRIIGKFRGMSQK